MTSQPKPENQSRTSHLSHLAKASPKKPAPATKPSQITPTSLEPLASTPQGPASPKALQRDTLGTGSPCPLPRGVQ
jgi:hypothetical protein